VHTQTGKVQTSISSSLLQERPVPLLMQHWTLSMLEPELHTLLTAAWTAY
jgi:hypothetical protein